MNGVTTEREDRFKQAVRDVIADGEHPSGARIRVKLGTGPSKDLNGEHTRWRREVLESLGWWRGFGLQSRWKPPITCGENDDPCENSRRELDPPPVAFHVFKLHEVTNGTRVWYLDKCVYMGHAGRWTPILKRLGVWDPGGGCRIVKEFLPKDHPAYDQEMNPHTRVRVPI